MDARTALGGRRWTGMVAALLGLLIGSQSVQASLITPTSLASPGLNSAVQGSSVNPANLVTNQYQNLGLVFSGGPLQGGTLGTTVVALNGVDVWASTFLDPAHAGS